MLQPLVELQYRGEVWHQRNGRDWTVEAFLVSEDGLDLDVARDTQTREAILRAISPASASGCAAPGGNLQRGTACTRQPTTCCITLPKRLRDLKLGNSVLFGDDSGD